MGHPSEKKMKRKREEKKDPLQKRLIKYAYIDCAGYANYGFSIRVVNVSTGEVVVKNVNYRCFNWSESLTGEKKNVFDWDKEVVGCYKKSSTGEECSVPKEFKIFSTYNLQFGRIYIIGDDDNKIIETDEWYPIHGLLFDIRGEKKICQEFVYKNETVEFIDQPSNKIIAKHITISWSSGFEGVFMLKTLVLNLEKKFNDIIDYVNAEKNGDFDTIKRYLTKYFPVIIYLQHMCYAPLSRIWSYYGNSFNFIKYRYLKENNGIIKNFVRTNLSSVEISKYLHHPTKQEEVTNLHIFDFSSFYPSIILEYFGQKNYSYRIHSKIIEDLLIERRKPTCTESKKRAIKLLLNAFSYGELGKKIQGQYDIFPSNQKFMVDIVTKGKEIMMNVEKAFVDANITVVHGNTDGIIVSTTNLDKCKQIASSFDGKWMKLIYSGSYNNGIFFSIHDYVLFQSLEDLFNFNTSAMVLKGECFNSARTPLIVRHFFLKLVHNLFSQNRLDVMDVLHAYLNGGKFPEIYFCSITSEKKIFQEFEVENLFYNYHSKFQEFCESKKEKKK